MENNFENIEDIIKYLEELNLYYSSADIDEIIEEINDLENKINKLYNDIDTLNNDISVFKKRKLDFSHKDLVSDFSNLKQKLVVCNFKIDKIYDSIESTNVIIKINKKEIAVFNSELNLAKYLQNSPILYSSEYYKYVLEYSKNFLCKTNFDLLKLFINN